MRTEVLDCVVMHAVVVAVEVFRGGEAFAALRAFRRSDVILLVSTQIALSCKGLLANIRTSLIMACVL